ncbi:hypothetical protein Metho_2469 (plasmid) [Methanomethylovorans hollandica DSM 15978]|uniref:Phosphatase, C-terminal domain of histone macro H2A1 like protein n=1 Tax=Methanomethylovorans hollandica (strain DSM 15978 / NBRC 107637 / DMS1) TaxID=867904 RepID=L0L2S6_METHD|nr:hypothetical protein [Methanomethylovorans hollandica]AGB50609.1 hypothetical protein Metho_2469 [Methanomethylovorans hollandica DSM 15978]
MKECQGDLWNSGCDYTAVTTNSIIKKNGTLVMGAGVAKQASLRYPGLPRILAEHVRKNGNIPYIVPEYRIVSFPTKYNWKDPSDLSLIRESARKIADILPIDSSCGLSKPGCGNGGLKWEQVKPLIEDILDDRFTVFSL